MDVDIADVTEQRAMLGVMGPLARDVLQPLADASMAQHRLRLPRRQVHDHRRGAGARRAHDLCGRTRLGVVHGPPMMVTALHDAIVAAGEPHGLAHAGYHAMGNPQAGVGLPPLGARHHRRGHPRWRAGLGFVVAWDKCSRLQRPSRSLKLSEADRVSNGSSSSAWSTRSCSATTTTRSCGMANWWVAPLLPCGATPRTAASPWDTSTGPTATASSPGGLGDGVFEIDVAGRTGTGHPRLSAVSTIRVHDGSAWVIACQEAVPVGRLIKPSTGIAVSLAPSAGGAGGPAADQAIERSTG